MNYFPMTLNVLCLKTPFSANCIRPAIILHYLRHAELKKQLRRKHISGLILTHFVKFKMQRNIVSRLFCEFRTHKEHSILRFIVLTNLLHCQRIFIIMINSFLTSDFCSSTSTGSLNFVCNNYISYLYFHFIHKPAFNTIVVFQSDKKVRKYEIMILMLLSLTD